MLSGGQTGRPASTARPARLPVHAVPACGPRCQPKHGTLACRAVLGRPDTVWLDRGGIRHHARAAPSAREAPTISSSAPLPPPRPIAAALGPRRRRLLFRARRSCPVTLRNRPPPHACPPRRPHPAAAALSPPPHQSRPAASTSTAPSPSSSPSATPEPGVLLPAPA